MASAKKRPRSKHPGVKLKKRTLPSGAVSWRAVYRDPDTDRDTYFTLDLLELGSAEARRKWCVDKSKSIAKRRMDIESGAPKATGTKLKAAVEQFFTANTRLRQGTIDLYRHVADKLLAWAAKAGVTSADDLTRPKLAEFRSALIAAPLRASAAGGRRGETTASAGARSPHTVNSDLRKVGTVLRYLHELDLLPRLEEADLRRALKRVPASVERVDYLKPDEIKALLESALAHDAETWKKATREEHAGLRPKGTTPRFAPIAPFVALLLLTGMRLSEGLALEWKHVHLEALDHDGRKVGEVHLAGATNKTHRARTVDLGVSPALRALLEGLHGDGKRSGPVFGYGEALVDAAAKRLRGKYGAPGDFSWQQLRRTCGTFLTNAPGIFGAASAYRSAKQLGHSVAVAERNYLSLERYIPREARTIEAAMGIEDAMARVTAAAIAARATTKRAPAKGRTPAVRARRKAAKRTRMDAATAPGTGL